LPALAAVTDRTFSRGPELSRCGGVQRDAGRSFRRHATAATAVGTGEWQEEVVLIPLPCWAHLTPEQYRERVAALIEEIEAEARAERERTQVPALGVETILKQNPQGQPKASKRSPAPRFHAATKAARDGFWNAYSAFVAAFREAAERLKEGDRLARFPVGSFPPGLPFVSSCPSLPP
jgi:hypothetical protein